MDRRTTSKSLGFSWHRDREKNYHQTSYVECYGNPSEMALQTFNHLLAIGKTRSQPQQTWQRPRHIGYVIHYVNRGQLWHRIHGHEFRVREGGACLLDCSKPIEQGNDQPQATDFWWIYFNGAEVPRIVAQLNVELNPVFDHVPRRRFQSLFRQLWTVTSRRPIAHEARCHATLTAILAEFFVARARHADIARQLGREPILSERMHAAIDYITRYSNQRIGLKDIADGVGLNLYYLAQKFRHEVGMAPIQYLNRFRIEQAKQLLATTDKTVGEIAGLVGIPDTGYFCRLFRNLTGETAESYRRKQRRR